MDGLRQDRAAEGVVGMILSTALLFRHLGWEPEATAVEAAVKNALEAGAKTRDLGGELSTAAMGAAIRAGLPS